MMQGPPLDPVPGAPKIVAEFAGALPTMTGVAGKSVHIPLHGFTIIMLPPKPPMPEPLPVPVPPAEPLDAFCFTPAQPKAATSNPIIDPKRTTRFIGLSLPP